MVMDTTTELGTPCAPSWTDEWIAQVDAREADIGRRICGARTLAGKPCPLGSNHKSGRCKHHGGFNLTGAKPGNRNAVVHGLYSQRLAVCGPHCPMWKRCPCAGDEILNLPPDDRPLCPYEQQVFETAYTNEIGEAVSWGDMSSPLDKQLAHHGALLAVMVWRAAAAMAEKPLTETPIQNFIGEPEHGSIHAHTEAFLRMTREYERWRRFMERRRSERRPNKNPSAIVSRSDAAYHATREQTDTAQNLEETLHTETTIDPREAWSERMSVHALDAAARGDDSRSLAGLTRANMIAKAKEEAQCREKEVYASYRPNKDIHGVMTEKAIEKIMEYWKESVRPTNETDEEVTKTVCEAPP